MSTTIDPVHSAAETPLSSPVNNDTTIQSQTDEPDSATVSGRPKRSKRKSPPSSATDDPSNKPQQRRTSRQAATQAQNAILQSNNDDVDTLIDTADTVPSALNDYTQLSDAQQLELERQANDALPVNTTGVYIGPDGTVDDTLYCICKQPYNPVRAMIGCDTCDNWFHTSCVGLSAAAADRLDRWYCDKCKAQQHTTTKQRKQAAGRKNRNLTANDLYYDNIPYQHTVQQRTIQASPHTDIDAMDEHSVGSETVDEHADDDYIDTPTYKANGRPVRSAAPTQSFKEIDTINELTGSGRKARTYNRRTEPRTAVSARTSMLRSRAGNQHNAYATQSYSIRRRASRIAILSDGTAVRLRVTYDGFDVLESDEYDTYDHLGDEFLVVEHDVDDLNEYWNDYSMVDNDDVSDVYVSDSDSDVDIEADIGVPFERPEPVDSDGNVIKTESNNTDTDMSVTTVKAEDTADNTTPRTRAKTKSQPIYDERNRVIYRLKQRFIDADAISDVYDDLGWQSIIQSNNDNMNATETDIKLLKHMEQRNVDVECILLQLEISKRKLYTAIAYAYTQSMKLIGATEPAADTLSPGTVRVGRRRNGVSSLSEDTHKITDGSTTPILRTPGTPKTILRRRKSLTTQFPRLSRRNSVGQLYVEADDSEDETPLYTDMIVCSGCSGKIPATIYYTHVKGCSTAVQLTNNNNELINSVQPSHDIAQYQQYGVPQPIPRATHPWFESTLEFDDMYLNKLTPDQLIERYHRLEQPVICGCPLNDNTDHTVPIQEIQYCNKLRYDCTEHILWVEQWRSELEYQYYLNMRRLELLEAEIEACKQRLYNRYNMKGLLVHENINTLLQIQADAIADAANVPNQIEQQQNTLTQQATNDLNELKQFQAEFKEKYLQQQKDAELQLQTQLMEQMEPATPIPTIQTIQQKQQHAIQQHQQQLQHQIQHIQQQQQHILSPHNTQQYYTQQHTQPSQQQHNIQPIYTATAVDDIHHINVPQRTYSTQSSNVRATSNPLDQHTTLQAIQQQQLQQQQQYSNEKQRYDAMRLQSNEQHNQHNTQQQQQLSQWDHLRALQQQLQNTPSIQAQQQYNAMLSPAAAQHVVRAQAAQQPTYQLQQPHNTTPQQTNNLHVQYKSVPTQRSPLSQQHLPPQQQLQPQQYSTSHIQYSTPQLKQPQHTLKQIQQSPLILQPVQAPH